MTAPSLGLVTVTYNSAGVVGPFLECVGAQSMAHDVELVVVDNASQDLTLEILADHGTRHTLIANAHNEGVARGNNQGIEHCLARGIEWILLVNNDTEFAPDTCAALLASARELRARVLTPRITYFDRPELDWFAGGHFSWLRGFQSRHSRPATGSAAREPRAIDYAPTCCMLVHASVFDEVGLMDPAYFVYWDDTDFCWRLRERRIPLHLDPRISIAHKVSSLTGGSESPFSVRYYSRNQVYFLRKHFPAPVVAANVAWVRVKNRLRLLTGRDTVGAADTRRAAILEGLAMPLPTRVSG